MNIGQLVEQTATQLAEVIRGGPGSGHHDHKGRPGEVGGSLPSGKAPVVKPELMHVARLALKYDKFEDMKHDFSIRNYHGLYFHLTYERDFKINPKQAPREGSTLAMGENRTPGLMVTTDIGNWEDTMGPRPYVAIIELDRLEPDVGYKDSTRGFGHEIFIFKPAGARVVDVVPTAEAHKISERLYDELYPQSSDELREIWEWAHANLTERGGPGSGHHGHRGRPGEVGGSLPSGAGAINQDQFRSDATKYLTRNLINLDLVQLMDKEGKPRDGKYWLTPEGDILFIYGGFTHGYEAERAIEAAGFKKNDLIGRLPEGTEHKVNAAFQALLIMQTFGYVRLGLSGPRWGSEIAFEMDRNPTGAVKRNIKDILAMFPDVEVRYDLDTSQWYGYESEPKDEDAGNERRKFEAQVLRQYSKDIVIDRGGTGSGHHGHKGRPGEVGGSLPSGRAQADPLSMAGMKALSKWERARVPSKEQGEEGILVLDDGTIIGADEQGPTSVNFNPTTMVNALKTGPVVITHTHPTDMPLSVGDVVSAMWDGLAEVRAVTASTIYRMKFTLTADFDRKSQFSGSARDFLNRAEEKVRESFDFISMNLTDFPEVDSMESANALAARAVYSTFWENSADRFPDVIELYDFEIRE